MKSAPLRLLLLCAAFVLAAFAGAQWSPPPPPHFESIDLPAANGRVIFIGKLVALPSKGNVWEPRRIPISVEKLLKGKAETRVDVLVRVSDEELSRWNSESARLLVSIPEDEQASIIDLSSPDLAVMTADLRLLRKPDEVIAELKSRIEATKGAPPVPKFSRSFPNLKIAGTPLSKQFNKYRNTFFLDVPADGRLEQIAKKQAAGSDAAARIEAINALELFFTPANVELIRGLLKDETGWLSMRRTEQNRLLGYRTNPVRWAAYSALGHHQIVVPPPPSMDPGDGNGQVMAIELDKGSISDADLNNLASYPNLSELYLSGRKLTPEQWALVGQQKSLRYLFLEGSNIRNEDLPSLTKLPNLRYLALANTAVTGDGVKILANSKSLRRIDAGQRVSETAILDLHRLRPDITVKPDPFTLLVGRRTEQPIEFGQNWQIYAGSDVPTIIRRRSFALVLSAPAAEGLEKTLRQRLPALGWKPGGRGQAEWTRATVTEGSKLDEIDIDPGVLPNVGPDLNFGERIILVSYYVDPTH